MGIKTSNQVVPQQVQKFIGTAFDTIQEVKDNLPAIQGLAPLVPIVNDLTTVVDSITDITTVADNVADVTTVADNMASILEVNVNTNEFNTRFLGSKTSAPTVDNNGNPLQEGTLYWNSVEDTMYVYNNVWTVLAASGVVDITSLIGNGVAVTFPLDVSPKTKENTLVFINGVYQDKANYSVASNTLTFVTPPANGAAIEIVITVVRSFVTGVQEEKHTLTSGQTTVIFTASIAFASFYVQGSDVDSRRLDLGVDYLVNLATNTVTLSESYPENTVLKMLYGYADNISVELTPITQALSEHINDTDLHSKDSTLLIHRGRALDDVITARFATVTAMIADVNLVVGDVVETFANQNGFKVAQRWEVVPNLTGTVNGGDYISLTGSGLQAKQIFGNTVCPTQYGAVPNDNTAPIALINTEAFRECCRSYSDTYASAADQSALRLVSPTSGDYNLSNGFTIPKGVTLRGGMGQVRIKILGATVDADTKIPLVTLGKLLNRDTLAMSGSVGKYVTDPPPEIDSVYLNPQNSNVAIVCASPGYKVGKIWVQAETAIRFTGTDGIVDEIIIEDGTVNGLTFAGGSNHVIGTVYTFVVDNPIIVMGDVGNVDIETIQCNFTQNACIQTNDGTDSGRISIGRLVCNQNAQYGTFTSVIRMRSDSCDIRIGELDARNYNGWALNNEQGLGNKVRIGHAKLRQTPNVTGYTVGTTAKGFRVNNCDLTVDNIDIAGISDSPFVVTGAFASKLKVGGGEVGTYTGSNPVVNIDNTSTYSAITLRDITNRSANALYNPQHYFSPRFSGCVTPFKNVSEGGRTAIKIPFCDQSSAYDVTITANTNTAGNGNYRRVLRGQLTHETSYNAALSTAVTWTTIANTALHTVFTPDIVPQVDITAVGTGAEIAYISNGYLVLSVPSTYTSVSYNITQLSN